MADKGGFRHLVGELARFGHRKAGLYHLRCAEASGDFDQCHQCAPLAASNSRRGLATELPRTQDGGGLGSGIWNAFAASAQF